MTCFLEGITIPEEGGYAIAIPFLISNQDFREIQQQASSSGKSIEELLIITEAKKLLK